MAGILDTIKLAVVLIFAIPAALAGLELLFVRGEPLFGAILLGAAIGLVLIKRYLTLPTDIPGLLAKRVFGGVAKDPEKDDSSGEH